MPFYRQVTALQVQSQKRVAIVVISQDASNLMKDTLSKEHVNVSGVYRAPQMNGLSGTPTLLIVDANGIVQRVFQGKLDSTREKEVLEIVKAGVLKKT